MMEVPCPDITVKKAAEQAKYKYFLKKVIVYNTRGTRVIWIVQSK